MNTKHTPGPWSVFTGYDGGIGVSATKAFRINNISAGTPIICDVHRHIGADGFSGEGNARLIAAAPELLYALSEMVSCFERFEDTNTCLVMDSARNAIANATWSE